MRLLTIIVFLFVSSSALAKVVFYFPDTDEAMDCKKKVQRWIGETDKMLPESWIPTDFHVNYWTGKYYSGGYFYIYRYHDNRRNIERIFEKVIVLGTCEKPFFVHEYAHVVIDDLMRRQSSFWQYYISWKLVNFQDINQVKPRYVEVIATRRKELEDWKSMVLPPDKEEWRKENIARIEQSLSRDEKILKKLTQAQQIQAQSPYPLNRFRSGEALSPFTELFADMVAVLVLGDWSVFRNSLAPVFENMRNHSPDMFESLMFHAVGGVSLRLSDEDKQRVVSRILYHRDFVSGLSIEGYPYNDDWNKSDPYFQFTPCVPG